LSSHAQVTKPQPDVERARSPAKRLPTFLQSNSGLSSRRPVSLTETTPEPRPSLPIGVGRLKMPVHSRNASQPARVSEPPRVVRPESPRSPSTPSLQVTTTVIPKTSTISPTKLTENNLLAFDSRTRKSQDMLSTIRKRTVTSGAALGDQAQEERRGRRISAPAELPRRARSGFEHPVLSLPGGF